MFCANKTYLHLRWWTVQFWTSPNYFLSFTSTHFDWNKWNKPQKTNFANFFWLLQIPSECSQMMDNGFGRVHWVSEHLFYDVMPSRSHFWKNFIKSKFYLKSECLICKLVHIPRNSQIEIKYPLWNGKGIMNFFKLISSLNLFDFMNMN